jgi:hypothetical protein
MADLMHVSLASNQLTGQIPDGIGACKHLHRLHIQNNMLVRMLPLSIGTLNKPTELRIDGSSLMGLVPAFKNQHITITLDMEKFCHPCSSEVMALIFLLVGIHYPLQLSNSWIRQNPCNSWFGVTCIQHNVSVLSLPGYALNGTLSQSLGNLTRIVEISLEDNHLTGHILDCLKNLPLLQKLDLSMKNLNGLLPKFNVKVMLNFTGNVDFNGNFTKTAPSELTKFFCLAT